MKIGEIKAQALHLMFATQGEDIDASDILDLIGSEAYGSYLVAMVGSINRCLADLESREIPYPSKIYKIHTEDFEGQYESVGACIDLKKRIPDYLKLVRVSNLKSLSDFKSSVPYHLEGDLLFLEKYDPEKETRVIVYRAALQRITRLTDNSEELPVSDRIAAWIPYWIVGELFREDEPDLAAEMMNRYHTRIQEIIDEITPKQNLTKTVYDMTEV